MTKVEAKKSVSSLGKSTYAEGSIYKTIFKITFPVLILMFINSFYQIIDALLAANLVEYGTSDWTGAQTSTLLMPLFALVMASSILVNFGFGTIYAQRMGAGDVESAKKSISTAHWTNFIISVLIIYLIITLSPTYFDNMLGQHANDKEIYNDAVNSTYIYTAAILISSFQGNLSRQLRNEGHIKAMSFIPIISIPFNIILDIVFMSSWGLNLGVVGAASATLVAILITSFFVILYTMKMSKEGKTNFTFSIFSQGVDLKLLGAMMIIGLMPFALQFFRAYNMLATVTLFKTIGSQHEIPGSTSDQSVLWLAFYSAATRPMALIWMPAVAVMQAGGSFLGYNYGAGNRHRVNKGVFAMAVIMVIYAMPQYILIIALSKYLLIGFGVDIDLANNVNQWGHILLLHRSWMIISIIGLFQGLALVYFMSTRKNRFAFGLTVWNLLFLFTAIFSLMFLAFKGPSNDEYWKFFASPIIWTFGTGTSSILLLIMVVIRDNRFLIRTNHEDND